jgi:hypothetical protein
MPQVVRRFITRRRLVIQACVSLRQGSAETLAAKLSPCVKRGRV